MTWTILSKELRSLRIYALLVLGYVLLEFGYVCVTEFPDIQTFAAHEHMSGEKSEIIAFSVIFGSIIGAFVLGQEREQQTQSFLDGLPVSRWQVFMVKLLAACMIAVLWPISHMALHVGCGALSMTSVTKPIHWAYVGAVIASGSILVTMIVCIAMMLSFLRQWFALGAGLAVWGAIWLRMNAPEWARWFNTTELFVFELKDGKVVAWPWQTMVAHGGVAVVAMLIAGCAYAWRDGWWSRLLQRWGRWRFFARLKVLAPVGAVAVWIGVLMKIGEDEEKPRSHRQATKIAAGTANQQTPGDAASKDSDFDPFDSRDTKHYAFLFRESQAEKAGGLIRLADAVHDETAAFFSSPPRLPERIVVDLASEVVSHAAGQTNWTKVRMPLHPEFAIDELRRILRHETAHVYIEQLSDGAATTFFNEMRAFHEGAATAAEFAAGNKDSEKSRAEMELWAALAHSRGSISLDLLCNNKALSRERDGFLVYPLGYVFARALIRAGGADAPRRAMETLRDSPPAPGTSGVAVWRHITQRCGMAWERVLAIYMDELNTLAKREHATIARLPRVKAKVEIVGDQIVIHPLLDAMAVPARLRCRVEKDRGLMDEPVSLRMDAKGNFILPRADHAGMKLRYLIGWQTHQGMASAYEPWEEVPLQPPDNAQ